LPALRDRCGSAVLSSHGAIAVGPFRVLGTASRRVSRRHGNLDHDRLLPFGDPPTGGYTVRATLPPGVPHARFPHLGLAGALVLTPVDGEAAVAARRRVLLHGGRLDQDGRLRRTRGGLRVADADLDALLAAIERTRSAGDPLSVVEVIDVARGFESEPVLAPARRRRAPAAIGEATPPIVGAAAFALFGVTHGTPTRRRFLAQTLAAIAGAVVLDACVVADDPCSSGCIPGGGGIPGGSRGSGACGSGSGSGSGSGA